LVPFCQVAGRRRFTQKERRETGGRRERKLRRKLGRRANLWKSERKKEETNVSYNDRCYGRN